MACDKAQTIAIPSAVESMNVLPAVSYTDPGLLARERSALFEAGWIAVAFGQQVPEPGDVLPVVAAGRPLLVTRDRRSTIHVFHNVCRHRGTQLIGAPQSCRNQVITCPYHRWSYALDGKLVAAPYFDGTPTSKPDATSGSELSLVVVRTALWRDIVFVNMSGLAPPFEDFVQPLEERWREFDFSMLKLVDAGNFQVKANWKLVCENFLDVYHVPWVHSQLGAPDFAYDIETTILNEDIYGFVMPRFDVNRDDASSPMPLFPRLPPGLSHALDLIYIFPNTLLVLTAAWLQVIIIEPESPGLTHELLAAYAVGDSILAQENSKVRADLLDLLYTVNGQDFEILERLQRGRAGTASNQCRLAPYWDRLAGRLFRRVAAAY